MAKFNLSDAAKAILLDEGAKEAFQSNISAKQGQSRTSGHAPHGEVGADSLHSKEQGDVGYIHTRVKKTTDSGPEPTKGVPKATPPGATPPVGSEGMPKLKPEFDQQSHGRKDLQDSEEAHEINDEDYQQRRDRIKSKLVSQMMHANPGAPQMHVPEEAEQDGEMVYEEEEEHDDEAQDKKLIKKMMKKEKMKEKMKEDMDALLGNENLSEEFVSKATTIFEAAVISRTQSILEDIQEELLTQFEEAVDEVKEDLATKVDDYMSYMAEEWMKENNLAIEKGLRAEIVEDFITGLKGLFEEHYIDIPEEKVNVVEELTTRVEELEESLNEQINASIQLKKELNEKVKSEAIHAVCEGLTQTQVEKMKALAESVDFTTMEEYVDKVVTLRESYFDNQVKSADSSALNEEITVEEEKKTSVSADPTIAQYAQSISKSLVK